VRRDCPHCGGELGQRWRPEIDRWEMFCRGCGETFCLSNYSFDLNPEAEETP